MDIMDIIGELRASGVSMLCNFCRGNIEQFDRWIMKKDGDIEMRETENLYFFLKYVINTQVCYFLEKEKYLQFYEQKL